MAKSIKQLLAEADNFKLCDGVVTRIIEYHGDNIDVSALRQEERVVFLVWQAAGIIGNGGFRYLFEGNFKGDPYFALTAEAFRTVGCQKAAEAVQKTLAIFPHSRPPTDIGKRLRYYLKRIKSWPTEMDMQFFQAQDDLTNCLARYIRSHAEAFAHLDSRKSRRPRRKSPASAEAAPPRQKTGPTLADLPRWARVAFAAHCARQVLPLLTQHWPGVPAKYSEGVRRAMELAEQSAEEGRAVEGLQDAVRRAILVAGAALRGRSDSAQGESGPENAYSGTIASYVAKAAEKAAEAAQADADAALRAAMEAWIYATDAATWAEDESVVATLQEDFHKLYRVAIRGQWTDQTRIPTEIWSML